MAAPRLGTVPVMTAAATEAGLTAIEAVEFVAELASTGPRTSSTTGSVRHTAANGSTAWPPPSGRRCARTRSRPWSRSCTRTDQGWCASVPSASGRSTLEQDRALEKDHLGLPDPRDEPTPAVHDLSVDDDHRRPTPVSSCAAGLLLISRPTACKFPSCATTPGGGWFAPQAPRVTWKWLRRPPPSRVVAHRWRDQAVDPMTVPVTRYRYRAANIPAPWQPTSTNRS